MTLFAEVLRLLREEGAEDIVVFGGGIIPADGIPELLDLGVAGIFTPGAPGRAITGWVHAGMGRPVAARRVTGRPRPGTAAPVAARKGGGPDGPWRVSAAGRADASASAGNSPCAQRKPGRNAGHSLRVTRRTHKVTAGAQEVVHRCPPFRTAG
ncbi:hypothetical protein GCM10010238_67460 [Streptomyces griseoviridis]|uniref:B12-binding domain-containing protein n=1 Tax=Streptomyces griseoviridis TaxID=45398 RepID=A0A918GW96_STRGD|nr:hypothetical protein GCM10010238_67460 [Streptomyces niveoruber]